MVSTHFPNPFQPKLHHVDCASIHERAQIESPQNVVKLQPFPTPNAAPSSPTCRPQEHALALEEVKAEQQDKVASELPALSNCGRGGNEDKENVLSELTLRKGKKKKMKVSSENPMLSPFGPRLGGPLRSGYTRVAESGCREHIAPHGDGGGVGPEPQVVEAVVGGQDAGVAVSMMAMTRSAPKSEFARSTNCGEDKSPRNCGGACGGEAADVLRPHDCHPRSTH